MNIQSVTVSAPGKLILFGEHAVVYGYSAIVAAVDKRVAITIEPLAGTETVYQMKDTRFVKAAAEKIREYCGKYGGVRIQSGSTIEYSGLGSSGAVTVAAIAALSQYYNLDLNRQQVFELAHAVVRSLQPQASGIDVAASVYGGVLGYQNGIHEKLNVTPFSFTVCHSGQKAQGEDLVMNVSRRYQENKAYVEDIFKEIQRSTEKARGALEKGNLVEIGIYMNEQQRSLQRLKVSTEKLDSLVMSACSAGAYGAKLSGAGGGDCIIAVAPEEKREQIEKALRDAGGVIIKTDISDQGVRIE